MNENDLRIYNNFMLACLEGDANKVIRTIDRAKFVQNIVIIENSCGRTSFHNTCMSQCQNKIKNLNIMKTLINFLIDSNTPNKTRNSILRHVFAKDSLGFTCLHYACFYDNSIMVHHLMLVHGQCLQIIINLMPGHL